MGRKQNEAVLNHPIYLNTVSRCGGQNIVRFQVLGILANHPKFWFSVESLGSMAGLPMTAVLWALNWAVLNRRVRRMRVKDKPGIWLYKAKKGYLPSPGLLFRDPPSYGLV